MALNIDSMIHVDCRVQACSTEFFINDIPIQFMDSNQQLFYTKVAHRYLIPGKNKLKMVVFPNQTPSIANQKYQADIPISEKAHAIIRIVEYRVGSVPDELDNAKVYAELSIPLNKIKNQNIKPFIFEVLFEIPDGLFPAWYWTKCEPINLMDEQLLIRAFAGKIHRLFETGNGQELANLCKEKIADTGAAIPARGPMSMYKSLVESVNSIHIDKVEVHSFDLNIQDFRLCADGRFVQMINRDWQSTIRTKETESGYTYPFNYFIGKLNGNLQIVF